MRLSPRILATGLAVAGSSLASAAHGEAAVPDSSEAQADAAPATPVSAAQNCRDGVCTYQFSPAQLLTVASRLVSEKKYDEARFMLSALKSDPSMAVPTKFLEGLIALESGVAKAASQQFRDILKDHPGETRVRLELAKALLAQKKFAAADYHLRLAQTDKSLPEDIARAVSNARSIIRSNRRWRFGFDLGIAPDTNINSATSAQTVDFAFSPDLKVPLTLNDAARARSGTGITASAFGSLRLPVAKRVALVADFDANMVNYKGKDVDDYSLQLGVGPEVRVGQNSTLSLQGLTSFRWYGARLAARQFGAKLSFQRDMGTNQRIAVQLDTRHTDSAYGEEYTGWQFGAAASYERVIAKSAIVSVSLFGRSEMLKAASISSKTVGFNLGVSGELPMGINAGLFGGASRAVYDAPTPFYAPNPSDVRKDWRLQARAYVGLRQIKVLGFSPSVEYNYSKVSTNYALYRSTRHRVEFKVARYF
jgi:outer membrane protein